MTIAAILIPVLLIVFIAVYRNHRDTAHLPRAPFGFDAEFGPDTERVRDEMAMLTRRATWQ